MNGDSILLVEDDKEIRQGVEIFLRSQRVSLPVMVRMCVCHARIRK